MECWRPVIPSELENTLTAAAEIPALKEAHRKTWASGDYPRVAERVTGVGERIAGRAGVKPGSQVLDVAAGTGNVSIPAARAGAHVATDLTPELFPAGRSRALDAGVEIEWISADAEGLAFEDERFDYVLSSIGVQFAPRHEIVARELVRVCRPGGTIALGNRAADGYLGRFWTVMGPYLPAPPSYASRPAGWGPVEPVEELFVGYPVPLSLERGALDLEAESPAALIGFMADSYGPLLGARNKLSGDGRWEPLRNELIALRDAMNVADDGHFPSQRIPRRARRQAQVGNHPSPLIRTPSGRASCHCERTTPM
jgi:SAM-dependent methyltransferase